MFIRPLLFIYSCLFAFTVAAETRHVANNGEDTNSCGSKEFPCRTISQGIINAGVNDLIQVGPGVYGDINNDGDTSDTGEESALNEDGALIKISKPVRILSTHGAHATFIQANSSTDFVLYLASDGIRIGKKKKGFTIKNSSLAGILVEGDKARLFGNTITSVHSGAAGIRIGCFGSTEYGAPMRGSIGHSSITSNTSTGIHLCSNTSRFSIRNNIISNNQGAGIMLFGADHRIVANNISGNASSGISGTGANIRLTRNLTIANGGSGVSLNGDGLIAKSNSAIGNKGVGAFFSGDTVFRQNNVFGNHFFDGSVYVNCGVFDNGEMTILQRTFYGASTGPGVDPADQLCSQIKLVEDNNFSPRQHSIRVPRPLQ